MLTKKTRKDFREARMRGGGIAVSSATQRYAISARSAMTRRTAGPIHVQRAPRGLPARRARPAHRASTPSGQSPLQDAARGR